MNGKEIEYELSQELQLFDEALGDIADSVRQAHTKPKETEIAGVPVVYEDSSFLGGTWHEWKGLLEEWLPRFDDAGWLDGLNGIEIGDGYMEGNGAGEYRHNDMKIAFPQDPDYAGEPWLVGDTKEYAIIHEMTHHAHISRLFDKPAAEVSLEQLNMRQHDVRFWKYIDLFEQNVSGYSASNYLEAVAETATGIILGEEYPDEVLRAYTKLKGPEPLRNWEEPAPKRSRCSSTSNYTDGLIDFTRSDDSSTSNYTTKNDTIKYKVYGDQ